MKLSELYEMIAVDLPVDGTNLGGESLRNTDLFIKYVRLYADAKARVELMENQKKNLLAEKRDYYSGNAPAHVYQQKPFDLKVKSEAALRQYLENDPDIVAHDNKMIVETQKVEVLQLTLDHIKSRNYSIRAAIDMTKFEAGA